MVIPDVEGMGAGGEYLARLDMHFSLMTLNLLLAIVPVGDPVLPR